MQFIKTGSRKVKTYYHSCSKGDLMKDGVFAEHISRTRALEKIRKPGHPCAIPQELVPIVIDLSIRLSVSFLIIVKT